MNKIMNLLKMDSLLILRDKIALYMAIAPALLAFVFLAVIGGTGKSTLTFAVEKNIGTEVVEGLGKLAEVELLDNREAVTKRVERMDSVAGVLQQGQNLTLLTEGNEPKDFKQKASLLLQRAIASDIPLVVSKEIESKGNLVIEITASSLLLSALFLAGAVSGFNIIAERETKAIRAVAMSPLGLPAYMAGRTVMAFILAAINMLLCTLVMNRGGSLLVLLTVTAASIPILALICLMFGSTANNQITAIASLKIIMPVCLMIPITSVFVPEKLQFLYYWFPNYWQFVSIRDGWAGEYNVLAIVLTIITGFLWIGILYRFFERKLGLR